jgi:hypothetical protein
MTSKVVDKENATRYSLGGASNSSFKGLGALLKPSSTITPNKKSLSTLVTPKLKQNSVNTNALSCQKELNNTASKQKRAFGVDLMNRQSTNLLQQVGKTPTVNKCLNMTGHQPITPHANKQNSSAIYTEEDLLTKKQAHPLCLGEEETEINDNYENTPVEHFFGNKIDTFDDLYDTRIDEFLLNMRITAAEKTRSPIKQIFQEDNNLSEQKRVRKMIRENKKMLRNANLIQNMVLHELPILEEDLPAAIILDDSF